MNFPLFVAERMFARVMSRAALILVTGPTILLAEDLVVSTDMTLPAGSYEYDNVIVEADATLTMGGDPVLGIGVTLRADSLIVGAAASISAEGQGYGLDQGPGANLDKKIGPSHGGIGGGAAWSAAYGSALRPVTLGSGASSTWGNSGSGGGAIHLIIDGVAQIDGVLQAKPHKGWTGAGGSILIEAATFTGSGSLNASGGRGACPSCSSTNPGGGGGRIAVYFETNTFMGTAVARGGPNNGGGYTGLHGEDGTVGFFDVSDPERVRFTAGPTWRFQANDATEGEIVFEEITIADSNSLVEAGVAVRAVDTLSMTRTAPDGECRLSLYEGSGSLLIEAGGLDVGEGCMIDMDGKGYPLDQGPGANPDTKIGPSHGGSGGGAAMSAVYGSALRPVTLGSGATSTWGNSGSGGGAIHLIVDGVARIDGVVRASADKEWTAAGGSILIETGTIEGAGVLRANGGRGNCPDCSSVYPGGGGGRIAVHFETNTFMGSAVAQGGPNSDGLYTGFHGEDGTVGFFDVSDPERVRFAAGPMWRFQANDATDGEIVFEDITIADSNTLVEAGVAVRAVNTLSMTRTAPDGECRLSLYEGSGSLSIEAGGLDVGEGCMIDMDGKGYPLDQGPGANPDPKIGPSHGGSGGGAARSTVYGSALRPVTLGSGATSTWGNSGSGGGAIHLMVDGVARIDGVVRASADKGWTAAGGSILIEAGTIEGAGVLRANGGRGNCPDCSTVYPGGGGGRIAVHCSSNAYTGGAEAFGGVNSDGFLTGFHGQNGTVGFFVVSEPGLVRLTTGHSWHFQENDAVDGEAAFHDMHLIGTLATVDPGVSIHVANEFTMARGDAEMESRLILAGEMGTLELGAGSCTLGEGCVIDVNGKGYPQGQGPGASAPATGAGHGGRGGEYFGQGGPTYGSERRPVELGSSSETGGGAGGGALRLSVVDTLVVDGVITADARRGTRGGSSGGSIWIDARRIEGSGVVSADGAQGGSPSYSAVYAGGGGGRIAIYTAEREFTGTVEVKGAANNKGNYSQYFGEDGSAVWIRELPIEINAPPAGIASESRIQYTFVLGWDGAEQDTVLVRLYPLAGAGPWELTGSFGESAVPGGASWEGMMTEAGDRYEMLVPLSGGGRYLFDVFDAGFETLGGMFEVEVLDIGRYVVPTTFGGGSNEGSTTFQIAGAGFEEGMRAELRTPAGDILRGYEVSGFDATGLSVTADLTGLAAQVADVVVLWDDGEEQVVGSSFEITSAPPGEIEITTTLPPVGRALRSYTMWVTVSNVGFSDIQVPVIKVSGLTGQAMRLSTADPFVKRPLLVVPIRDKAPFSVLPPGEQTSFPVIFMVEGGIHSKHQFSIEGMEENTQPVDWGGYAPSWKPVDVSAEAWALIWANFTVQMGPTQQDLADRLRADAVYLAAHENPTTDVYRLFDLEFAEASAGTGQDEPMFAEIDVATRGDVDGARFVRYHRNTIFTRSEAGPFGKGWSHGYDYQLMHLRSDQVHIRYPGGSYRVFNLSPRGEWQPVRRDHGVLRETEDGFEIQDGAVTRIFDSEGKLARISRPDGVSVILTHNAGKLVRIDHSNGESIALEYTGDLITELINQASESTTYHYEDGRLTSVLHPGGDTSAYSYYSSGPEVNAMRTFRKRGGDEIQCTYDALGRLEEATCAGGAPVSLSYPSLGIVRRTGALGAEHTASFDGDDFPMSVTNPEDQTIAFLYRDDERFQQMRFEDGSLLTLRYDSYGNPVELTDPLGKLALMEYTPQNNQIQWLEDALGLRTDFLYNPNQTLDRMVYSDTSFRRFEYDEHQRVNGIVNRRNQRIDLLRDPHGRIMQKDLEGGGTVGYLRDSHGRIRTLTDWFGVTEYTYNSSGFLTDAIYPDMPDLSYTPDERGRRHRIEDSGGFAIDYIYGDFGLLDEVRTGEGALIVSYTYDTASRLRREDRGNGTACVYEYTPANRIESIAHLNPGGAVAESFAYGYTVNGKCKSVVNSAGEITEYFYDPGGRLLRVEYDGMDFESFAYDAAGNRQSYGTSSESHSYIPNASHEYASIDGQLIEHDADGNLTNDGVRQFNYDVEGYLKQVTDTLSGPTVWDFAYDGLGRRRSSDDGTNLTQYLNDPTGLGWVAAELDGEGAVKARFIHGLGLAAMIDASGAIYYFGFDRGGNTRVVTDSAGLVVNRYTYQAYGEPREVVEAVANPYRYGGAQGVLTDPTGLLYMRNRYYDPVHGRFVSPDPAGLSGGPHPYVFASNDPVNLRDPSGLDAVTDVVVYGDNPEDVVKDGIRDWIIDKVVDIISDQGKIPPDGIHKLENMNTIGNVGREVLGDDYRLFTPQERTKAEEGLKDTVKEVLKKITGILTGDTLLDLGEDLVKEVVEDQIVKHIPTEPVLDPSVFDTLHDPTLFEIVAPGDPNEKEGSILTSTQWYVDAEEDVLSYTVYFENDPRIANAPAQEVKVEDQLDEQLDWSTFKLTEIVWGETSAPVPAGVSELASRVTIGDYRPEIDKLWWVDITVGLDSAGKVTWFFRTLDPETGDLPEDPYAGFLPVNDESGRGQGHVSFTIRPRAETIDGTTLRNSALIKFDTEAPIVTNEVQFRVGPTVYGDPTISALSLKDGHFQFSVEGLTVGLPMVVEMSGDLAEWEVIDEFVPDADSMGLDIPLSDDLHAKLFFRIRPEAEVPD